MRCNEKSEVALDEAQMFNGGFWKYPCYEEIYKLFDHCGADMFELLYEMYRMRIHGNTDKARKFGRVLTSEDLFNSFSDRKVLHY